MDPTTCRIDGLEPVLLPITGTPVTKDGLASTQGIAVTIGQPGQFFSLRPTSQQNNTFVTNADRCVSVQNYSCIAYQGGVYTPSPNAYQTNSETSWNGTEGDSANGFRLTFYNDFFQIAKYGVPGMPFFAYVDEATGGTNPSGLGMGPNSSFLQTLLDNKVIGTKQWSMWPGSVESQISNNEDGLLILGGYDAALVGSDFTTLPMRNDQVAMLYVEIVGMSWTNATSTTDLMPEGYNSLIGGINPSSDAIENFPYPSAEKLGSATGYTSSGGYYFGTFVPIGYLTITLSGGLTTVIPAENLFRRLTNYSSSGQLQEPFPSQYATFAYKNTGVQAWPSYQWLTLGVPYLTQHLLVVDPDEDVFHLADVVRSKAGTTASNLKPLCTGGPATNKGTSPTNNTNQSKKLNVAAIGGGLGGGVAALLLLALLLLALLLFFFRRHTKKSRANVQRHEISQQSEVASARPESMASLPPKYMQSNTYENNPPTSAQQYRPYNARYSIHTHTNELAARSSLSPTSDVSSTQATTAPMGYGPYWKNETNEMDGGTTMSATSGPVVEMPASPAHY